MRITAAQTGDDTELRERPLVLQGLTGGNSVKLHSEILVASLHEFLDSVFMTCQCEESRQCLVSSYVQVRLEGRGIGGCDRYGLKCCWWSSFYARLVGCSTVRSTCIRSDSK
jgi:hypothetical protein